MQTGLALGVTFILGSCLGALSAQGNPLLAQLSSQPTFGSDGPGVSPADIRFLRMTPDEDRLVYLADAERDELLELYALKSTGGPAWKLNLTFADGRTGVSDYRLTADGRRVLYLGDHAARGRGELYSVSVNGGVVTKIPRPGSTVAISYGDYLLAPDSQRVVFIDRFGTLRDLFVAPLDGRSLSRLSRGQGNVHHQSIRITPDSTRVLFQSLTGNSTWTIRSTRLDGSEEPLALTGSINSFGPVPSELTPDGSRVVYGGGSSGLANLFSRPIDGSEPAVQLDLPFVDGRVVIWSLAADGKHVVFDFNEGGNHRLYAAPVDGSRPPALLAASTGTGTFWTFFTSPAGRVVYMTNPVQRFVYELQSAPLSGGAAPVVLSSSEQNMALGFPDIAGGWGPLARLAPGADQAVFLASDADKLSALFAAPLDGSRAPTRLADLAPNEWIGIYTFFPFFGDRAADLDLDPVSGRAVYLARGVATGTSRLLSVPLDASAPARELSGALPVGAEGPRLFVTSPRHGRVYYTSDALEPGVFELFSVAINGSRPPRLLVNF